MSEREELRRAGCGPGMVQVVRACGGITCAARSGFPNMLVQQIVEIGDRTCCSCPEREGESWSALRRLDPNYKSGASSTLSERMGRKPGACGAGLAASRRKQEWARCWLTCCQRAERDAPTLGQGLDQLVPQQMPHVSPASVKKFSRYSKCPIFSEATKRASH